MPSINLAYLEIRLSGGASNADPNASLGGVMSSTRVLSQSATLPSNITGVVIDDAAGNAEGAGTLAFTAATSELTWTPNGGTAGAAVAVTEDGKYTIKGSAGYLLISVTVASLPGTDQTDSITIANLANKTFDDISKAESYYGDTEYRAFYLVNTHPTGTFIDVLQWIGAQPNGADSLEIALDTAGVGDGSTTGVAESIADEGTSPVNPVFSAPTGTGDALSMGDLGPAQAHAFWQKRVCPAAVVTQTLADLSSLRMQVNV